MELITVCACTPLRSMGWPWAASRIGSFISSISSSNRRVGWAPRTAVCEAVRAWIVLPQAKVVLLNVGALANHARGTCPAAHRRCRRSTTRADCCPEPPKMMTSVSNRMALAAASSASRDVLPPKPRDAIHNATGARANKASQKACRRRHVPVTARHGGNADPEGGLDPGQDVTVGAVARASPAELGLEQGRILQGAGQEVG